MRWKWLTEYQVSFTLYAKYHLSQLWLLFEMWYTFKIRHSIPFILQISLAHTNNFCDITSWRWKFVELSFVQSKKKMKNIFALNICFDTVLLMLLNILFNKLWFHSAHKCIHLFSAKLISLNHFHGEPHIYPLALRLHIPASAQQ